MRVQAALATLGDDPIDMPDAIRTDDLVAGPMPCDEMHVVSIVAIDVALAAGAFADCTKRDLTQASDLAQRPGNLLRAGEHDAHLADSRERLSFGQAFDFRRQQALRCARGDRHRRGGGDFFDRAGGVARFQRVRAQAQERR